MFFAEVSLPTKDMTKISTMHYDVFLKQLAQSLHINIQTLHQAFADAEIAINDYLNASTIRILKEKFDTYLLYHAIDVFGIGYMTVTNTVHPTKITNAA